MAAIITGGIAKLKIDGVQYMVRGSSKVKPQFFKNTPITNQSGETVFTQTATSPMLSFSFSDYGGLSISQLTAINGATINFSQVSGKSWVMTNAVYVDETELNAEDGSFAVNFSGQLTEQVAA